MHFLPDYRDYQSSGFDIRRMVRLIELNTYAAFFAVQNTGSRLEEWMRRPEIGDLVVEVSSIGDPAFDGQRCGNIEELHRSLSGEPEGLLLRTFDGAAIPWNRGTFIRVVDRLDPLVTDRSFY